MKFAYFSKAIRPRDARRIIINKQGYGRNWPAQRKAALERDNYTCQKCGHVGIKVGRRWDVSVHHKRKIAWFVVDGVCNYEFANDLSNLITLCKACHRYADGHENKSGFRQLK